MITWRSAASVAHPLLWRIACRVFWVLAVWSLLAWAAAHYLVVRVELARADALVVLSGSALYAERARWAAQLYQEGRAPRVILTNDNQRGGWSDTSEENLFFYQRALEELRHGGVPEDKIEVLMQPVFSTYEEAALIHEYVAREGLRSVIVVTSPQHSRRALWSLRRVFRGSSIEVGLSPAVPGARSPSPAMWWLKVSGWRIVAGEYVKLVYYWFKYR